MNKTNQNDEENLMNDNRQQQQPLRNSKHLSKDDSKKHNRQQQQCHGWITSFLAKRYYFCMVLLLTIISILLLLQISSKLYLFYIREIQYQNISAEMNRHDWSTSQISIILNNSIPKQIINQSNQLNVQSQTISNNPQSGQQKHKKQDYSAPKKHPNKLIEVVQKTNENAQKQAININKQIDYQKFTGITVNQVTNALKWMQIKSFDLNGTNKIIQQQKAYYQQKYSISKYEQLPICVVIPTYNNAQNRRHINNINSVLMQDYHNYHIVIIDDASTDETAQQIVQILKNQNKLSADKYSMIRNNQQQDKLYNLRMASNSFCQLNDIFIVVDGDDELIGRQVFKLYNSIFQKQGVWFVYSNFLTINNYVGYSRFIPPQIIKANNFRDYPFVTSHLRAFYNQLFRNIQESDLRDEFGDFFSSANDVAISLPILQQSQQRIAYIPELTYYYNANTGQNNHKLRLNEQKTNDLDLRKRKKYNRLEKLFN